MYRDEENVKREKKRFLENWKSFIVNLDDFQVDS